MSASLESVDSSSAAAGSRSWLDARRLFAVVAGALLALARRVFTRPDPHWSELNDHLLSDIGETRASADWEALHHSWRPPQGLFGGGAGAEWFSHASSRRRGSPLD